MAKEQTRSFLRDTANYGFDNAAEHSLARFKALSIIFDPGTIR